MPNPRIKIAFQQDGANRHIEWIMAMISLDCTVKREDGVCSGEIIFPSINLGRRNIARLLYDLFDDPTRYGADGRPGSFCIQCGVRMAATDTWIEDAKNLARFELSQKNYQPGL